MKKPDRIKPSQTHQESPKLQSTSPNARTFWFCAALLVILLASIMARDIDRPFYGLHSWKEAAAAWRARCYLKYPLSYTKGLAVWAVGDPPAEKPNRSLDHPQLGLFMPAIDMAIFGVNERGARIGGIIRAVLSLLIFLRILRGLTDDKTTLLAGLFFVLFPLTGYFGVRGWITVASLLATWCYLVLIGSIKNGPAPKPYHKWALAISLFLALQFNWEGFFYALAIGVHYVFRCIRRKQLPEKGLLAILIIAPLASLVINFMVLAAGHGWDWQKVYALYKWRAAKGEMPEFLWGPWFAKMWEFAVTNFTLPVLIIAIAYLTLGQLYVFAAPTTEKQATQTQRRFPQFWLFLMPAIFQLFVLKGALWRHQYWESPAVPFIAIAVALAIMLVKDIISKVNRPAANTAVVVLVVIIFVFCTKATNFYYHIRWQQPAKIEMFKDLNQNIPPDKALLSFEDLVVNQHPV
ncbi:MAG: glycosyltransferase family 39 protein, partial [Planctomycetota bacterium]